MKMILVFLFFIGSLSAQPLSELLKNIKVDKAQVVMMIDQMEQAGKISKKDAIAAKKQLKGMSQSDMDAIGGKAVKILESSQGKTTPHGTKVEDAMKMVDEAQKGLGAN